MTADETIATLDRLGRDVVPAITAITPRHDIDEALLDPTPRGPRRDSRTPRLHRPRPGLPDPETWTLNHVLRHHAAERPDAVCLEFPTRT